MEEDDDDDDLSLSQNCPTVGPSVHSLMIRICENKYWPVLVLGRSMRKNHEKSQLGKLLSHKDIETEASRIQRRNIGH
jgi:hypothetical protein